VHAALGQPADRRAAGVGGALVDVVLPAAVVLEADLVDDLEIVAEVAWRAVAAKVQRGAAEVVRIRRRRGADRPRVGGGRI